MSDVRGATTVVSSDERLFSGWTSGVEDATHARFSIVPATEGTSMIVTAAESFAASVPTRHTIVPLESVEEPRLENTFWRNAPAGIRSRTTTPPAHEGPRFRSERK